MNRPEQAVILCGGRGERLRPLTDTIPKPMAPVGGKPFLAYLIEQLRDQGIRRVLLLTGYRGEVIREYFGTGAVIGVEIAYSHGPADWETGRRLWEAREALDAQFLLLYSDNYAPFSINKLLQFHRQRPVAVTLLVSPKKPGNIRLDSDDGIAAYDSSRATTGFDYVEIGYMRVQRDTVLPRIDPPDISFSKVLRGLAADRQLRGLVTRDTYHSISDLDRLRLADQYLAVKRIVLIDRDGTINRRAPRGEYVRSWKEFAWIPETVNGMRALGERGFRFIILTNQAGIARGAMSVEAVSEINARMMSELAVLGVDVIETYVCPHHWDDGCQCRKPAPGMFHRASRDHLLRLDRTIYIGDDPRDAQAAFNAECLCVLIGPERDLAVRPALPIFASPTLSQAVPWIISHFEDWESS